MVNTMPGRIFFAFASDAIVRNLRLSVEYTVNAVTDKVTYDRKAFGLCVFLNRGANIPDPTTDP